MKNSRKSKNTKKIIFFFKKIDIFYVFFLIKSKLKITKICNKLENVIKCQKNLKITYFLFFYFFIYFFYFFYLKMLNENIFLPKKEEQKAILLVLPFESSTRALQSTPFQNPGGGTVSVTDGGGGGGGGGRKSPCLI